MRSGFMVAIMEVLQLPPRESRRTDVIIELRYGMCRLARRGRWGGERE